MSIHKLILLLILSCLSVSTMAENTTIDPRVLESRKIIKEFAGELKKELVSAMEEGGPVNAINVCNIEAPAIATSLSEKYQWDIARTSLKTRNPNNNPDDWELLVLQQFEQRKQNGENVKQLDYSEDTEQGFRYMKAIPTQGLCLACHGENIQEPLKQTLSELYPEDKAIGFKAGDIRGAFTILRYQQ